jgi:hypothetical protein
MSGKGEESRVNANYERFPAQIRIKGHLPPIVVNVMGRASGSGSEDLRIFSLTHEIGAPYSSTRAVIIHSI